MNEKEILREVMSITGMNQTMLAAKMGYKHQSTIGNVMMRKSMYVDNLTKLLNAMGYDLIVRGREEVRAPGGVMYVPEWKVECKEVEAPTLPEDI